jgi:pseudouridine-5'-phosphate glycosidase
MPALLDILPAVSDALESGAPVVALESSVLAQGLPIPHNHEALERMATAVKRAHAIPAVTGVANGVPTVGLNAQQLERFLKTENVRKVSARDVAFAIAARADGATTVAATLMLGYQAGIEVFATGGIGGVHHDAPYDESADLMELSRTPMIVVCAGAKSILNTAATAERLESYGVPVIGFRTSDLPGFFTASTGIPLAARAETAQEIAAVYRAHRSLDRPQALLVVQPPPAAFALPRDQMESAVTEARAKAAAAGVTGAAVTPYLLGAVASATGGRSIEANLALLEQNALLAGEIAAALSGP